MLKDMSFGHSKDHLGSYNAKLNRHAENSDQMYLEKWKMHFHI